MTTETCKKGGIGDLCGTFQHHNNCVHYISATDLHRRKNMDQEKMSFREITQDTLYAILKFEVHDNQKCVNYDCRLMEATSEGGLHVSDRQS